jgi:two-component system response regulator WspF
MRIGIVNEAAREIDAIRRALALEPQHTVAWLARNAEDAVVLCAQDLPDLVLLDLSVPDMGGIEATRHIMAATPCAILLLTADVGANASRIFEAMGYGALDAIDTPQLNTGNWRVGVAPFLIKLDAINSRLRDRNGARPSHVSSPAMPAAAAETLVAIGASAGGPAAVRTVLHGLPKNFPAAIVVVQHMDQRFAPGMVEWLSEHTALPIRMSQEGDIPVAGVALLASTNDHLILKSASRLGYTSQPADYVYRPSVDVFFQSICKHWRGRAIGVLLTGMGSDGALGLKALRGKGHYTIAQDRASSAVYGMPKAAIESGAAVDIVAADHIAEKLMRVLSAPNEGK